MQLNWIKPEAVARDAPKRRYRLDPGICFGCDRDGNEGPWHDASKRCASGGHPHCTCDTCF
jgi:hypothetical protein